MRWRGEHTNGCVVCHALEKRILSFLCPRFLCFSRQNELKHPPTAAYKSTQHPPKRKKKFNFWWCTFFFGVCCQGWGTHYVLRPCLAAWCRFHLFVAIVFGALKWIIMLTVVVAVFTLVRFRRTGMGETIVMNDGFEVVLKVRFFLPLSAGMW